MTSARENPYIKSGRCIRETMSTSRGFFKSDQRGSSSGPPSYAERQAEEYSWQSVCACVGCSKFVVFLKRQLPRVSLPTGSPLFRKKTLLIVARSRWKETRRGGGGPVERNRNTEKERDSRCSLPDAGCSGSRWILWPFHRLSCGIRPVPVHLLSFLTERIPPAADS